MCQFEAGAVQFVRLMIKKKSIDDEEIQIISSLCTAGSGYFGRHIDFFFLCHRVLSANT